MPKTRVTTRCAAVGTAPQRPRPVNYPFAAVVGHRAAKHALALLAVEPALRGVLLTTTSGSAETILARGFTSVLPESDSRVKDYAAGAGDFDNLIELPLNVTEDRLLGALDLERTLAAGKRIISPGLLAQANDGVLCVDSINLLDSETAAHIAQALDTRRVCLERDSISAIQSADFLLVGTFNPSEGEPSPLLRERVGLIVDSRTDSPVEDRAEMMDRELLFERDPAGFAEDFAFETAQVKSTIEAARARLRRVRVSKDDKRRIALAAIQLGVEGSRADRFALKAARANAALSARSAVNTDDLIAAIRLVLAPRAKTLPPPQEEHSTKDASQREGSSRTTDSEAQETEGRSAPPDRVIPPIDSKLPPDLLQAPLRTRPTQSRSGKRLKSMASVRGRYVRSQTHATREAKVAIDATLRAAAPFQLYRRRSAEVKEKAGPLKPPKLKQAAGRIDIDPSDLRFKQFKQRSGVLFIFAVDASGSMALNRMAQAKGALSRVLQQAYLHRDKVALISFRGEVADILLAPTRSVELAKRLVDALPAGGGTPISAGVIKAIELARISRLRGMSQAMLVLFTDGRANVRWREEGTIDHELRRLGGLLETEGIGSVVVDTKTRFVSSGEGQALARMLGARYLYLPRFDAAAVYDAVASATGGNRQEGN
jgi:magnesium chelatase subunit D